MKLEDTKSDKETDMAKATYQVTSCLTCDISELGTFLKPKDTELVDFLIDMWDGQIGKWKRSLATQDAPEIENPWLNIMGCVTPSWLQNNFDTSMIFGGLTSRCIFVWGNKKDMLIPYPADLIESDEYKAREADLVHDLNHISKLSGEMTLTPEAREWGGVWYEQLWNSRPEHLASERFSAYIARKQTHIHKLAMVISASTSDSLKITAKMLELANETITANEYDMIVVFDSITDNTSVKHLDEILTIIRRNKTIYRQTLWRHVLRQMDEQQFLAAIQAGINAGYINQRNVKGNQQLSIKKEDSE